MTSADRDMMDIDARTTMKAMVHSYSRWVSDHIEAGSSAWFVTFMFKSLPGGQDAVLQQMRREIESLYARFVTRVVRRPQSPSAFGALPILIAFPDAPAFKRNRPRLVDVVVNEGIHAHGLLIVPGVSRLRISVA